MEMKKEEDELLSLQLSSEIRERIEKAIQNLLYSPIINYLLTDNAISSHIDNPEVISRPINMLPLNPSFPQIAFHYLPFKACINHDHHPNDISEDSDFVILNQYHYDLLQNRCSRRVLEDAWTQWLRLGECQNDQEQNMQWREAKDMRSR